MRHRSVRTRIGSILLTGAMLLSLLPTAAWATEVTETTGTEIISEETAEAPANGPSDTGTVAGDEKDPDQGTEPTNEVGSGDAATVAAITTQDTLEAAIEDAPKGGTVRLDGDIDITEPIVITKELTLDLNGNTIAPDANTTIWQDDDNTHRWSLIRVAAGGNLTVTGEGTLRAAENDSYAIDLYDETSKCTIENGTFVGNVHAVYVFAGELTVNGGTFSVQQKYSTEYPDEYVLNCFDASYESGTASITVSGGTFVGFNPSNCRAEGAGTDFCAPGYIVEKDSTGGEISYTVTKLSAENAVAQVGDEYYATLAEALEDAQDNETVKLLKDTVITPVGTESNNLIPQITISSDVTIDLNGKQVTTAGSAIGYTPVLFNIDGATVTITGNGTIDVQTVGAYDDGEGCYGINITNNGSLTIENGTFTGAPTAVQVTTGTLTILGGTFRLVNIEMDEEDLLYMSKFVVNCIDSNFANGTARIYIKGGSFCFDPDGKPEASDITYVPAGYESVQTENGMWTVGPKADGGMEVTKPETSGGSVSSKLDGIYTGSGTEITTPGEGGEDQGVGENDKQGNLTIDLKVGATEGATAPDKAALTVTQQAASTLDKASSLTVTADAGTVKLDAAALDKMSTAEDNVVISIEKGTNADDGKYTFTATSGEENLFPEGQGNGFITLTVPAPSGMTDNKVFVYYLGPNGAEEITNARIEGEEGSETVTWTVSHFSTYYVTATEQSVSVTVDGTTTTYTDFSDALVQIEAGDTATVILLDDVTLSRGADVSGKVTLDLNGHKITGSDGYSADYLLAVKRGGDLTINDTDGTGAITTDTIACAVKMTVKDENDSKTPAKLTVNGGTIKGNWYGIVGNGTRHNTEITINNGTIMNFSKDGTAIYHPQDGSLTITGGKIQSPNTAIEIRSGSLTVTGGIISGGTGEPEVSGNGNGTTTSNTGIAIAQHTTTKPITVNITGGTISGGAAVYESNPQNNTEETDGSNAVTVSIADADLNGDLKSSGFGDVSVNNTRITGDVDKAGTGNMGIVDSTITGTAPDANNGGVTYVNTKVNGTVYDTVVTGKEAMVNGTQYEKLEDAVDAAKDGNVVTLLGNVVLDGTGKGDTEGLLEITKSITLNGNGHTITAKDVRKTGTTDGPSMINIVGNVKVTIRNLDIDGLESVSGEEIPDNTKHGLNIYGGAEVTVENVTIKHGKGYGSVANGSAVTVNGLTTSGNGWGGINVDSKSGEASLVVESATINEKNSIKFENSSGGTNNDPSAKIKDGNFQYITKGDEITKKLDLTISGGKFAVGTGPKGASNVSQYLEAGLAIDSNGNVYTPSQGGSSSGGTTRYNVSVEDTDNGSIRVSPSRASRGQTVTITVDPDEGYVLDRLIVRDSDGDRIDVERQSDTRYTFEMPRGAVTIEATFVEGEEENVLPFRDVDVDDWFYDAVVYAYENDLMSGVSAREFAPNSTLTRAMVAQMLWAMEGKPQVNYLMQYADVGSGDWYAEAVRWASSQGIMSGYGDSQFGPNDPVTRQQLALILYNYAKEKDYDTTGGGMALREYSDYDAIADWAVTGLGWAVEHGLISGMGDGVLAPTGGATRAQVAQIFMNFCEDVAE